MIDILIGIVIGIVLVIVYIWYKVRSIVREMDRYVEQRVNEVKEALFGVIVERENGQIYCYAETDRQFVCQGNTLAEIRAAFKSRYPDKTCYIAGGDDDLVAELREELRKDLAI